MKEFKTALWIWFNGLYPIVIICITAIFTKYLNLDDNDLLAAILLVIFLIAPYIYLSCNNKIVAANWYFIAESAYLAFFLLFGRYVDSNLKFGYEVWGTAFVFIKMWDSYLKIRDVKGKQP
ncbi:hypothetical protein [Streptococcus plurextorum]|uniref:hypothetical protein n=1 Tax=Streptococcus plurextorum TaxID=456876 RepID=UPI000488B510|nr:hypothetical protein [Streptococcus plurextorum]